MKAKTSTAKKKTAKKKVAAPKKMPTGAAKPKKAAPRKRAAARRSPAVAARATPPAQAAQAAQPVEDVDAQLPVERALTDEEREAMAKCAQTALAALDADGPPAELVARIGAFVEEVRTGRRPQPSSQDVRLGLGVLWGEQVRAQVGWRWVHLSYPHGFASYALVPDDRAFACFPLNRLSGLMSAGVSGVDGVDTSVALFDSIRLGTLPERRDNAYLVIG